MKEKTPIDKIYRKWIGTLQCVVCGISPSDPHHVPPKHKSSMGLKTSDYRCLPLCGVHHNEYHTTGRDSFAKKYAIDYEILIEAYNIVWKKLQGKE